MIKRNYPSFTDEEIFRASVSCWEEMDSRDKRQYMETLKKNHPDKPNQKLKEQVLVEEEDEKDLPEILSSKADRMKKKNEEKEQL